VYCNLLSGKVQAAGLRDTGVLGAGTVSLSRQDSGVFRHNMLSKNNV